MENAAEFKVTYLNGPTAIIEIAGLRFITDPTFDPLGSVYPIGNGLTVSKTSGPQTLDLGKIDYVLLSHDQHHDNFDHMGRTVAKNALRIFTTVEGAQRLGGQATGLQNWESISVNAPNGDEITITGTPARHGPAGIEQISGEVTGFILSVKGSTNFQIYVTGDTVYYAGVAEIARRFDPVYIFIFAGGAQPRGPFNVTMGTNDAIDTSADFPRAIIIPLHYQGWSHYTQGGDLLTQSFETLGISDRLRLLKSGMTESLPV